MLGPEVRVKVRGHYQATTTHSHGNVCVCVCRRSLDALQGGPARTVIYQDSSDAAVLRTPADGST